MATACIAALVAATALGAAAAPAVRGGNWKVVYSSAEGPEGRALEVLTERLTPHLLRDHIIATQYVLPMEKDGGARINGKRDRIVIGIPSQNATLRGLLGGKEPPEGGSFYRRKTVVLKRIFTDSSRKTRSSS